MKLNLLIALFAALTLTACSQDTVDSKQLNNSPTSTPDTTSNLPDRNAGTVGNITRSYILSYDESGRMSFMATFRVKGTWNTTVKLDPPSRLTVNGREVSDKQLISKEAATLTGTLLPIFAPFAWLASGTHYFVDLGGQSPYTPVTVVWTDPNGQDHSDTITMHSPGSFNVGYASTSGFSITVSSQGSWSASLRQQSEGDQYTGKSAVAVSSGGSLNFSASDLSGFHSGPATLRVDNSVDHGYITTTYHFSDRDVSL